VTVLGRKVTKLRRAPEPLCLFMNVPVLSSRKQSKARSSIKVERLSCKADVYMEVKPGTKYLVVTSACPDGLRKLNGVALGRAIYEMLRLLEIICNMLNMKKLRVHSSLENGKCTPMSNVTIIPRS
jgi:hypothetical protein